MISNRDETCLELNEIVYHLAGRFWKQTYNNLVLQLSLIDKDDVITPKKAISKFRKEVRELAENNQLSCKVCSMNGSIYYSLIPFPIYIGIDKATAEISVSTPHINTMHFQYNEYKAALKWIQNYLNIDLDPLSKQKEEVKEKYYLNTKAASIIQSSIKSVAAAILGKKNWRYEIRQNRLRSEIYIETQPEEVYQIDVYHKAFSQDSSLLVDQLNNPHEEFVDEKIHCYLLKEKFEFKDYEVKDSANVYSALKNLQFTLSQNESAN